MTDKTGSPFSKPIEAFLQFLFAIVFDVVIIQASPGLIDAWVTDGMMKAVCYGCLFMVAIGITLLLPYMTITSQ